MRQERGLGLLPWQGTVASCMIWGDLGILRLRGIYKRMDVNSTHISSKDNFRLRELGKAESRFAEL